MLHSMECWQHATFNVGKLADDGFEFRERCVGTQGS
jgi:hypothetical protein